MKKNYAAPKAEIEMFTFTDVVTMSPEVTTKQGIIDGGEEISVTGEF